MYSFFLVGQVRAVGSMSQLAFGSLQVQHLTGNQTTSGAIARLKAFPLRKQWSQDRSLCPAHSSMEKQFPSSADSRRASRQLLVKE